MGFYVPGFIVPNVADAAFSTQAEIDALDWEIQNAAFGRTWVESGCLVSSQGVPNQTVAVASGVIRINGTKVTCLGAVSLALDAAHASFGRYDMVTALLDGTTAIVQGIPADVPVFPVPLANRCVLAAVYVPPLSTAVEGPHVTDKRIISTIQVTDIGDPPTPGLGLRVTKELNGTINGSNKIFQIPDEYQQGSFELKVGGLTIRPTGFALSGAGNKTVTIAGSESAPQVGEWVGGSWTI